MKSTSPLAYVPWHLRDFVTRALTPPFLVLVLGGLPTAAFLGAQPAVDLRGDPTQAAFVRQAFVNLAPLCFTLGAFIFMTQSAALDRERQHVRFMFSHPVSPALHYLTRFFTGLSLYLLCFLPIPVALRLLGVDVPVLATMVSLTATLVLIGGLATLCSSLVQKEGAPLIGIFMGTQILQQMYAQDLLTEWLRPIARGLPPLSTLSSTSRDLLEGLHWPTTDLIHVFGYGIGMLVAGLLVIRRAPLVR